MHSDTSSGIPRTASIVCMFSVANSATSASHPATAMLFATQKIARIAVIVGISMIASVANRVSVA